ncbi:MAG: hypothetical protein Q9183_005681 [Haloplaca sp. 2 TL-2023]
MDPPPDVIIHGQSLGWDQTIPFFMISDKSTIKEEERPLILQLLLWDLWWKETHTLKYQHVKALLYAVRNPGESAQAERLESLRDLYASQSDKWKEQKWAIYQPVVSNAQSMLAAVESMNYEDLEVVAYGMTFTNLCVLEVITVLKYVRQQKGLSLPQACISRPDRLVAFMVDFTERERPSVWDGVMEIGDEDKTKWVERFKEALKVGNIPMKD